MGYKPITGYSRWTRSCQNSGTENKRRPEQSSTKSIGELIKKGFKYNKKTDQYEKKIHVKTKLGKQEIVLQTIKLSEMDKSGNKTGNDIYYVCDPTINKDHIYIGFLMKSNTPDGFCMPCCFKKDQRISTNDKKSEIFSKCINETKVDLNTDTNNIQNKLYILQNTNKISSDRYGFLPTYLDYYLNKLMDKICIIKNHYLIQAKNGYFFKQGINHKTSQFLEAMSVIYNTNIRQYKKNVYQYIKTRYK